MFCINLDWLMVYCREPFSKPLNAAYYRADGEFYVSEREYGTPQYSEMFKLQDVRGFDVLEIRRNPKSLRGQGGIFEPEDCHIRLSNRSCYMRNPIEFLRDFLLKHGYTFISVSRVDICLDFFRFDNGVFPSDFLTDYIKGIYAKINQSNISIHGRESWDVGKTWNSCAWGASTSLVRTKFYNKSLEMRQVKDKTYIRRIWRDAGLLADAGSNDIWRVEFSVSSSAKKWKSKSDEWFPNNLTAYDGKERLKGLFFSLVEKYFHFKVVQQGKSKYKCPSVKLWVSPLNCEAFVPSPNNDYERSYIDPDLRFLTRCAQISNDSRYNPALRELCRQIYDVISYQSIKENAVQ